MPILIEIEGIDGSGKTSAMESMSLALKKDKIPHILTKEAGNPHLPVCSMMRDLALNPKYNLKPEAMECLFTAMRFANYEWLNTKGDEEIVISDRGLLSHFSYGYASLEKDKVDALFRTLCKDINETMKPYVIFFRIDPKVAAERIKARNESTDNVELLGLQHQEKVAQQYEELLTQTYLFRGAWIVDANEDQEGVQKQLKEIFLEIQSMQVEKANTKTMVTGFAMKIRDVMLQNEKQKTLSSEEFALIACLLHQITDLYMDSEAMSDAVFEDSKYANVRFFALSLEGNHQEEIKRLIAWPKIAYFNQAYLQKELEILQRLIT